MGIFRCAAHREKCKTNPPVSSKNGESLCEGEAALPQGEDDK